MGTTFFLLLGVHLVIALTLISRLLGSLSESLWHLGLSNDHSLPFQSGWVACVSTSSYTPFCAPSWSGGGAQILPHRLVVRVTFVCLLKWHRNIFKYFPQNYNNVSPLAVQMKMDHAAEKCGGGCYIRSQHLGVVCTVLEGSGYVRGSM